MVNQYCAPWVTSGSKKFCSFIPGKGFVIFCGFFFNVTHLGKFFLTDLVMGNSKQIK